MSDAWLNLRRFTEARIAQGRSGSALPTEALLDFQLAHAEARDAVLKPWDMDGFAAALVGLGCDPLVLHTDVPDRVVYLQRPDLGRRLAEGSRQQLLDLTGVCASDVVMIMTNGLSSSAIERHGPGLFDACRAAFAVAGLSLGPVCLVADARVALSDEVGALLGARLAVIVVGERPGLSAADSLGIYLTYGPRVGNSDADRNCISNIRPPAGLAYAAAALKLCYLSVEALRRGLSGVLLKDEMQSFGIEEKRVTALPETDDRTLP